MDGMDDDDDATILVLSHLRYDFVFKRPQQVVSRLARNHRVLFIEEPVRLDEPPRLRTWQPTVNVQVLQPQTPLAAPGFHDDQVPILRELLQATFASLDRPIVWLYTPMALPLVAEIDARGIVYECMDELSACRSAPRQLQQREAALLKRADVVFAGGRSLYRAKSSRHPLVMCIPSAVDAAHFRPDPEWQDPWPDLARPRLGYFGVIDERIDMALLDRMAHDRPAWQILMVGPLARIDPDKLPRRPNIHWLGQHAYESLPRLVAYWDACLMPFALNEATRYISPAKTLEYMAAGRPIVSTHVRDVADCYSSTVRVADSVPAFMRACDAALAEPEPERSARRQAMLDLAADQSWDAAVGTMERAVTGRHRRPADAVYENLVLGAGPTGLAAALGLSRDTLLVERGPRVGGLGRSIQRAGYTFDHAGRVMFSQDPYVLALYERVLGANVHWQYRESSVFSNGAYMRQLDPAVTAELTAAYNRKLWTVPLDEIEPRALHNLVLGEKGAGDPLTPQVRARFGYPLRGGFQALMDCFLPLLPGQLRTGTSVAAVDAPARRVTLASGESIGYQNLVVTEPLPVLVQMLVDCAPSGVREAASSLRSLSMRCVNIGVRRSRIAGEHWLYYPADTVFHRIFMQSNASPSSTPAGCSSFTCEITYSPARPLPCVGDDLVEQVLADCRRVNLLRHDDVLDVAFEVDIPLAYVIDDQDRARSVERIRNWLTTLDIHVAGRWAEWDHYNGEHAFLAGRRVAQRLTHRLVDTDKMNGLTVRSGTSV